MEGIETATETEPPDYLHIRVSRCPDMEGIETS